MLRLLQLLLVAIELMFCGVPPPANLGSSSSPTSRLRVAIEHANDLSFIFALLWQSQQVCSQNCWSSSGPAACRLLCNLSWKLQRKP